MKMIKYLSSVRDPKRGTPPRAVREGASQTINFLRGEGGEGRSPFHIQSNPATCAVDLAFPQRPSLPGRWGKRLKNRFAHGNSAEFQGTGSVPQAKERCEADFLCACRLCRHAGTPPRAAREGASLDWGFMITEVPRGALRLPARRRPAPPECPSHSGWRRRRCRSRPCTPIPRGRSSGAWCSRSWL